MNIMNDVTRLKYFPEPVLLQAHIISRKPKFH